MNTVTNIRVSLKEFVHKLSEHLLSKIDFAPNGLLSIC